MLCLICKFIKTQKHRKYIRCVLREHYEDMYMVAFDELGNDFVELHRIVQLLHVLNRVVVVDTVAAVDCALRMHY